ncbi:hypothetical protein K435DRAFT_855904 [Dendrothele bispora CBS 962.96]|uniref:Uncharacterized protein n=1 Tax=Dendrothele bispora (strain CBS 962.96) TaxID=1314807 RepID=A0A4S8M9Y0_DENBC|nr:hypothetical protein K435DRAFT_855904 [Dendrothele bispora CBS 962.96]
MSLTVPVEDLNRLQVSSHISSDGTPAIDLSFRPPVSDDLTYPSTNVKHCGVTVTFRRSVNTDGSGWSLAISTSIPNSCYPFASGGNIETHLDIHEIASHKSPSSLMSAPNEIEVETTQHHSTTPVHSFHLTDNAMTEPEPADDMNQNWLLQLMGHDFCASSVITDMNESNNSNCRGPSIGLEFPQNQQHPASQPEFNSTTDEFHDSVSDFDNGTTCDNTDILFMGMSI